MLALITTNTYIPMSHHQPLSSLNGPLVNSSLSFKCNPNRMGRKYRNSIGILSRNFGFKEAKGDLENTWCCWCKQGEGDVELEAEIMGFMEKSEKPTMFPTKKELIRAGRMDLAEAIEKRGGWYSLGWDEEKEGDNVEAAINFDTDIEEFQRRVQSCKETASLREHSGDSIPGDVFSSEVSSNPEYLDSLHLTASASLGRSLEIDADEDSGIAGILSRLERQRNRDFGLNLGENGYVAHTRSDDDMHFTTLGIGRIDLEENGRTALGFYQKGVLSASGGKTSRNSEPETWRTWSNQRAGFQHAKFEAAEISFSKDQLETDKESYHDGIFVRTEEYAEDSKYEQIHHKQIQTRLQHLECELNTALHSFRSKREECFSEEVTENTSNFPKLSDACEFEENEFVSAKERLRSIRAKLVILEGKTASAIIDAQKIVEAKQKRIDGARKALRLLRSTCIVWPNSASDVLLAGSFDGWTSQRKMDKSRTGMFSICLKLYPGRYEIKFIVDDMWKVDPLRPTVKNNGYENNLLIIT